MFGGARRVNRLIAKSVPPSKKPETIIVDVGVANACLPNDFDPRARSFYTLRSETLAKSPLGIRNTVWVTSITQIGTGVLGVNSKTPARSVCFHAGRTTHGDALKRRFATPSNRA